MLAAKKQKVCTNFRRLQICVYRVLFPLIPIFLVIFIFLLFSISLLLCLSLSLSFHFSLFSYVSLSLFIFLPSHFNLSSFLLLSILISISFSALRSSFVCSLSQIFFFLFSSSLFSLFAAFFSLFSDNVHSFSRLSDSARTALTYPGSECVGPVPFVERRMTRITQKNCIGVLVQVPWHLEWSGSVPALQMDIVCGVLVTWSDCGVTVMCVVVWCDNDAVESVTILKRVMITLLSFISAYWKFSSRWHSESHLEVLLCH